MSFFLEKEVDGFMKEKYMKIALKQAKKAYENDDVPVGAVIVKDGKIIARAYNKKEKTKDATDHAEIRAIKKACRRVNDWRLTGCVMYVTLKPCVMCMGAIKQARIEKVFYGAPSIVDEEIANINLIGNVLEEECSNLLRIFFKDKRNM